MNDVRSQLMSPGQGVGVAGDQILDLFLSEVSGDEHRARRRFQTPGQHDAACGDFLLEPRDVGGTSLVDDVDGLGVRGGEDVEHVGEIS